MLFPDLRCFLRFLLNCPHLLSLVLHNVKEVKEALPTLTQLDRLEHLDISQVPSSTFNLALHCTALHCTALHCTALPRTPS